MATIHQHSVRHAEELIDMGRLPAAEKILKSFIAEQPDDMEAIFQMARLRSAQDRDKEAEQLVMQVLKERPEDPEALIVLVLSISSSRPRDAIKILDELQGRYPSEPYYPACRARIMYYDLDQPVKKIKPHVDEALRLDSHSQLGLVMKFVICVTERRTDEASDIIKTMMRIDPEGKSTQFLLSEFLEFKGDYKSSIKVLTELVRQFPEDQDIIDGIITAQAYGNPLGWIVRAGESFHRRIARIHWGWYVAAFILLKPVFLALVLLIVFWRILGMVILNLLKLYYRLRAGLK